MKYMLNFSGGLDSTYVLWKHMTEQRGDLLIHHVVRPSLKNSRWTHEYTSVKSILAWFRSNGYRSFHYEETFINMGKRKNLPFDSFVIAFLSAVVLRDPKYQSVKYLYDCSPLEEYERLGDEIFERKRMAKEVRDLTLSTPLGERTNEVSVIKGMNINKQQAIKEMPSSLVDLTWSCRKPNKNGDVCGKCHTCSQLKKYPPQPE